MPAVADVFRLLDATALALGENLRSVLTSLGEDKGSTDNKIARGMIAAATTMSELSESGPVRDAAIIVEFNQQQLYRVATYGAMLGYARLLGRAEVLDALKDCLERSRAADRLLSDLAVDVVNPVALLT